MSYHQVAIYKNGGQPQPASWDDRTVARPLPLLPQSSAFRALEPLPSRPIKMSTNNSYYDDIFAQLTPEQKREFASRELERKRALRLGFALTGVHDSPEHEAYDEIMKRMQSQGAEASTSQAAPSDNQSEGYYDDKEDIQYKSARIFSPTNGRCGEVTVIEDSACRFSFITADVAKRFNLAIMPTPSIECQTWAGAFTSNRQAQVTWFGKSSSPGNDWFYIAPETAPATIEMVVGTQFMSNHPDAFEHRKQLSMLTVAPKMKKNESAEIESREARANAEAAELERRKRQAKQKRGDQKHKSSSSRTPHSKKSGM